MAQTIIYVPKVVFDTLKQYAGMAQYENRIEIDKYCLMVERLVINVIDKNSVVIKRHGKIVFEE